MANESEDMDVEVVQPAQLQIKTPQQPLNAMSKLHYLPCNIKFDGQTDVNSYFRIKEDKGELTSHLRGRELKGKTIELPAEVKGLCITPGDDNPLRWEVTGEFKELTLWQHDLPPDAAQIEDYLGFFEIANAVHS